MTEKLRELNTRLSEFLIELSLPLLTIGFIMATMDILLRGRLATYGPFEVLWGAVQAIAIDGLFIAIWLRIFSKRPGKELFGLIPAGIVMALVATMFNAVLTYQQVNNVSDSLIVMQQWHINVTIFAWVRAGLVAFVAVLIIPIREYKELPPAKKATSPKPQKATRKVTVIESEPIQKAIEPPKELSKKAIVLEEWLQRKNEHGAKKAIADKHGIGYSTMKKWTSEV